MKRMLSALLLGSLLTLTAYAAEPAREIALTFDDGPSGRFTARLLDGLAERDVHATFFLCGYRVDQYPELAARIAAEGHEIGSHGDAHQYFTQLSPAEVCADLRAAREKLTAATAQEPTLLRPPGGLYDVEILRRTVCADLPIILWSIDPDDWCRSDSAAIASDVIRQAKRGDIVLLHDMSDSSVTAALQIVDALRAQGFRFVTVSELADCSGTELKGGTAYHSFSFSKKASISARPARTEPWANCGFPPPRPFSAAFRRRTVSRRSSVRAARTYL